MTTATTAELKKLLAPHIGAKLRRGRPTHKVDVLALTNAIDADIRDVTSAGIERFFYSGCEIIPWAEVRRVTIRAVDAEGSTVSTQVFEHRPAMKVAA